MHKTKKNYRKRNSHYHIQWNKRLDQPPILFPEKAVVSMKSESADYDLHPT